LSTPSSPSLTFPSLAQPSKRAPPNPILHQDNLAEHSPILFTPSSPILSIPFSPILFTPSSPCLTFPSLAQPTRLASTNPILHQDNLAEHSLISSTPSSPSLAQPIKLAQDPIPSPPPSRGSSQFLNQQTTIDLRMLVSGYNRHNSIAPEFVYYNQSQIRSRTSSTSSSSSSDSSDPDKKLSNSSEPGSKSPAHLKFLEKCLEETKKLDLDTDLGLEEDEDEIDIDADGEVDPDVEGDNGSIHDINRGGLDSELLGQKEFENSKDSEKSDDEDSEVKQPVKKPGKRKTVQQNAPKLKTTIGRVLRSDKGKAKQVYADTTDIESDEAINQQPVTPPQIETLLDQQSLSDLRKEVSALLKPEAFTSSGFESSEASHILTAVCALSQEEREAILGFSHDELVANFKKLAKKQLMKRKDVKHMLSPKHKRRRHH
jgi:hypothetical protein